MHFKTLFFLFLLLVNINIFANDKVALDTNITTQELLIAQAKKENDKFNQIQKLKKELAKLQVQIPNENMWVKSYASYLTSIDVKNNLENIEKRIKYLSKHLKYQENRDELNALINKQNILASQVGKLKENFSIAPFSDLITPPKIDKIPEISNPFDILTGLSLIKSFDSNFEEYKKKKENLDSLIKILHEELDVYKKFVSFDEKTNYKPIVKQVQTQLDMFTRALDTMNVTMDVYQKRLDLAEININKSIEKQLYGLMKIGAIVLFIFLIFFLLKLMVKKYITDNERFYMANKIITFTNFTIILLVLFFNYIENASYIVTILGFASAGIAIAMKDWFMSLLGWLVIVFGGSIHVGDRIRVDLDGMKYVGDVLDISLLRITILEDITLTSIMQNRRAGRIIFIPNNYVFTKMIANYTHNSLKTVWDGIKITITFDSNHKKAMHLVKGITKKYSKGYTDITRKQLNKLRQNYSLKNTNVEP